MQPPPEIAPSDGGGGLLSSMLPMLGSIGAIVMVSVSNAGPTGFITGGMFLLSSLGFVAVNGWRQRSQRTAATLAARREYLAYLTELRRTVRVAAKQQRRAGNWQHPAPVDAAVHRRGAHPRLGALAPATPTSSPCASAPATSRCASRSRRRSFRRSRSSTPSPHPPPIASCSPTRCRSDLPLGVTLRDFARIEITGDENESRGLARAMLLHAATMHDPDNLQIVIAADDAALAQWEWAKWLPHTHSRQSTDSPRRRAHDRLERRRPRGAACPADVRERPRFARDGSTPLTPHVVIVTDGARIPVSDVLLARRRHLGRHRHRPAGALGRPREPERPAHRLRRRRRPGRAELLTLQIPARSFRPDTISIVEAEATARRLLPLFSLTSTAVATRSTARQADLVDLLGLPDVRDIDFDLAWRPRLERDRLRVPIGQDTNGAPIVLDIKESAQQGMGPHGVMIGATGSGKSEVLRTLVLALALTHSPEQLNFVLVDFKGGATFAGMAGMPHVSAIITNLGDEISLVDRFQDALQGEIVRRQELLRSSGNFANVSDYEKARRGGRSELPPLPSLLIVADEFSELLAAKPEFVESFVNIGRVGRSLQVHLLLASQRLEEGKLRGLDTYLSYRIGLRTFSAAESRTILGVPDAYTLPQQPGVGFLKSDTETMTQFRAAYVSAPPPRRRRSVDTGALGAPGRHPSSCSRRPPCTTQPRPKSSPKSMPRRPASPRSRAAPSRSPWHGCRDAAPSPTACGCRRSRFRPRSTSSSAISPSTRRSASCRPRWREAGSLTVPLGIVDVPLEQRRENLVVSLGGAAGHMVVVGAPLSGKSTLARTTMIALALTNTPLEVQFFVLDFGGGAFSGLQGFPHLSGLATRSEPDIVRRTVAEVTGILNAREVFFRQNGIDSIDTYRQRRAAGQVDDGYGDVFLVIDGWGTLRSEFEALEAADPDHRRPRPHLRRARRHHGRSLAGAAGQHQGPHRHPHRAAPRRPERLRDRPQGGGERHRHPRTRPEPRRPADAHGPAAHRRSRGISLARRRHRRISPSTCARPGPGLPDRSCVCCPTASHSTSCASWCRRPRRVTRDRPRHRRGRPRAVPSSIRRRSRTCSSTATPARASRRCCASYANEIMRHYGPSEAKIFVVDYRRALLGDIPDEYLGAYLSSHEMASGGLGELAAFFQSRIPGPDVSPEQLRARSWWTGAEGFILVDDYDLVATSQGNPLAVLAPLLAQAGDLGLHVILTRRAGGASRAAYDPIIQRLTDLGTTGILLSGNPEEGQLIGKVKAVPAVPGRAQIVSRSRGVVAAQLAWVPPRYS